MINMDVQDVSNSCKCITIIFHLGSCNWYICIIYQSLLDIQLPFIKIYVPIPTCLFLRVTLQILVVMV